MPPAACSSASTAGPRSTLARDVLVNLVNNELTPGALLAFARLWQSQTDSCRTNLELALHAA